MSTPASDLISAAFAYGHFRNPRFPDGANVTADKLAKLTLDDQVVRDAIYSWQDIDQNLSVLTGLHHGRAAIIDGDAGPATFALADLPRCRCPDYGEGSGRDEATGSGAWPVPGCDPEHPDRPNVHSIRVNINTRRATDHHKTQLEECLANVVAINADIGLAVRHILNGDLGAAEMDVAWEDIPGSVIGYAYFPTPNTCRQQTVARLDTGYQVDAHRQSLLMVHEYTGHSAGLPHTRGGIMNPSLLNVPLTWRGDPSYPLLKRLYGGDPIEPDDPTPDPPVPDPDDPTWPTPPWLPDGKIEVRGLLVVNVGITDEHPHGRRIGVFDASKLINEHTWNQIRQEE